jgi:hypothetical protein
MSKNIFNWNYFHYLAKNILWRNKRRIRQQIKEEKLKIKEK